jgi:hypothetical protein
MMIMKRIAKQAAFYRGYQADECSLVPLTILLAAAVPLWLLVYLVGASKPAVTNDIRNQDRRELPGLAHYAPPAAGMLAQMPAQSAEFIELSTDQELDCRTSEPSGSISPFELASRNDPSPPFATLSSGSDESVLWADTRRCAAALYVRNPAGSCRPT